MRDASMAESHKANYGAGKKRNSEKWRIAGFAAGLREFLISASTLHPDEIKMLERILDDFEIVLEDWKEPR